MQFHSFVVLKFRICRNTSPSPLKIKSRRVKHSIGRGDIRNDNERERERELSKSSNDPTSHVKNENNFSIPRLEIDSMESW